VCVCVCVSSGSSLHLGCLNSFQFIRVEMLCVRDYD
jgi:hypothetical protein